MRGIIVAGGKGTRLYPMTESTSKQLLPVGDRPMIYYPLWILMQTGITQILIISTPKDIEKFRVLLGNGQKWGLSFSYAVQEKPQGVAQALIIAEEFIGGQNVAVVLGDNFLAGPGLKEQLQSAAGRVEKQGGAVVLGCYTQTPEEFGVLEFDASGRVTDIKEKPENPESNYCVPGVYFYDSQAAAYAKGLRPSARGELEITDLNRTYLEKNRLSICFLEKDVLWVDMGTCEGIAKVESYIQGNGELLKIKGER